MRQRPAIQKTISVFLLLIFMISAAPKNYFHTFLAGHKDVSYCSEIHKATTCLHQQSVQCHFQDLVVSSSFMLQVNEIILTVTNIRGGWFDSAILNIPDQPVSIKEVRGPPSVC